ncbi:hypothetical protein KUTeg_009385 [Tegillarca granosa]|uniref:Chitin-binding type-2 domain-containing protein n=1 Tax=Tegillarca granosa TaxID=220873 RepID=A0ABQ9F819_TEGGR|nr:hypothetical protein KUTeg_009385 [Tegillarca granosa]
MYIHPTDIPLEPITNPVLTINTLQDPNQPFVDIKNLPDGKQDMVQSFIEKKPKSPKLSPMQQALIDSFVKVNSQHQSEEQARHTLEVLTNAIAQAQRQRLISQPQGTNIQQTNVFNTIFNSKEGGISSQSAVNTLQIIADALALLSKSGNFPQTHGGQPGHAPNVVQINQQNQLTTNTSALTTAMLVVTSNRSETHQTQPTGPTTTTDVISGVSTQQNNFGLQVDPKVTSKQIQTSEPRVVTTVTETKTQQPSQPTTKSLLITSPMSQPTQQPVVTVPITQSPPPPNPVDFVWGQSLSQLTPETGQKPYQISPPVDNINAADPYVQFAGSLSQSPSNQNSFETWQGKESTFQFQTDPTLFPSVFQTQFPPYQFGDNTQLPHDQTPGQHPGVIVQSVAGESQPFPQPFANNQQPMPPENNQLPNINTVKNLNSMGNLQQNQFFNQNQDTGIAIHTQNQPPQAEYKSGLANFLNGQGSESNTNLFNNVPGLQQHIPPAVPLVNDVQVPKDVSVQPTPPIRIDSLPAVVDGAPAIQNNAVPLQDLNPTTPPINNDQQLPTPVALDTTTPMQVPLVGDGTENNLLANGQTPEIKSKTEKDNQTIGSGQITNQEQNFLNQQQTDTGKVRGVELVPEQPVNLVTDITVQQAHSLQNNQQDIEKQQMLQESNLQPETTQQQNMSLQTSQINEIIQTNLEGNQPKPVQIIETRIQQPGQGIQHQNTSVEQAGQSQENIQPPSNEINAQATIDVISVKTNKTDQVPQNISKPVTEPNKPKFHSTFLMSPEELSRISQQQNQASLSANTRTSIAAEANNIFQNGGLFGQIDDLVGGKTSNNEILKQPSESIPVTSSKVDVQNVATDNSGATTTVQPQNKGAEPGGLSLNELLWGPNYRRLMDNYATLEKQRAAEATEAARQLQEQRRLEQEKLKQQTTEPLQTNRVPVTDMTGEKTDQSNSFDLGNIIGPTFQTIKTKTVQPVQIRTTQTMSRPLSSLKLFDINYPLHVPVIVNGQLVTSKATNRHSGMSSTRSQTTSTRSLDESRIATRTVVVPSTTTGSIKQGQSIVNVTKPVQTQAQRELYDLCLGSQFVNGIAYNAIPSSCHEFVQCFYYEDPCLRSGVSTYSAGDCRSYYECNNGQPRPMCCPFGMRHEPGVGKCVVDTSCISWCKETGDEYFEKAFQGHCHGTFKLANEDVLYQIKETLGATISFVDAKNSLRRYNFVRNVFVSIYLGPNCRMMPFYTNAGFYFDEIPGVGMMPRMCAGGSTFNPALCVCETPDKIDFDANNQAAMISKCKPEFSLDFTDEFRDLSGNNLPLNHEHVHIDRQAAKFEGDGKITIWRFSGGSFGDEVAFTLRFKPIVNWFGSQRMDLLSNCDREGPSVGISVTASNIGGYVSFMANASESGVTSFDIAYKGDGWNNVTYIYDGKHLTGSVNGVSNTIPLMVYKQYQFYQTFKFNLIKPEFPELPPLVSEGSLDVAVGTVLAPLYRKLLCDVRTIDQRRNPLSLGSCNYVNNYVGLMDDVRIYLCVPRWLL